LSSQVSWTNNDRIPLHEVVVKSATADVLTVVRFTRAQCADARRGPFTSHVEVWEVLSCIPQAVDRTGAEVEVKDSRGRAPLQLASAEGQDEWIHP
jgi:hypothetical protein